MNDREIVALFLERDESAIKAVSEKYKNYCAKIAANILGSYDEAEDCVNDALMRAWENIPPHKPAMLSTFLGKLTRNIAINMRRQSQTQKRGGGETELVFEELSELIPSGESVEREFDLKELTKAVNDFLYTLSEQPRNIFICRYWYCDSIHDIAAELGISKNKVYVTLTRTRKKLCEYLRKEGYDL